MGVELCHVRDVPEGNGLECRLSGSPAPRDIILFRTPVGLRAYLNACPHQGRSLTFAPQEFVFGASGELVCPHHGACFDLATGQCVSGPCHGDCLTPVAIEVHEGKVLLGAPA